MAKSAVMEVGSELLHARLPTAEELAETRSAAAEEAEKAKQAAAQLVEDMKADLPPPISFDKLPESTRMAAYIDALAAAAESKGGGAAASCLRPVLLNIIGVCLAVQPWLSFCGKYSRRLWDMLPTNVALMLFGAALCYFGGTYTASIAAIEAFRTMGYDRAKDDLEKLAVQLKRVEEANTADDLVDDDGDGIADVDQTPSNELMRRKIVLVMTTIEEPERINSAIASMWAALLAVLATLRLEFAASTAIALGIVDMVKFPAVRIATPGILALLGPTLKHWCNPLIEFTLAFIGIVVAWYAKATIAAFYAAVRGGRLFAQGFFGLIVDQAAKGIQICPGLVGKDFDPNESVLDEIVGFIIAAQGFMFQLTQGFVLPFPFNVLLLPLSAVEWILRLMSVTSTGVPAV